MNKVIEIGPLNHLLCEECLKKVNDETVKYIDEPAKPSLRLDQMPRHDSGIMSSDIVTHMKLNKIIDLLTEIVKEVKDE